MAGLNKRSFIIIIAFFVVFAFSPAFIALVTDWWWFSEVGYTQIFLKSLAAKIVLFSAVGIFAAVFLLANFFFAIRPSISWTAVLPAALIGQPMSFNNRIVKKFAVALGLVIAFFFGLAAAVHWQEVLKFISGSAFGATDPIFNKDIGFYIFSLPVLQASVGFAQTLVILTLAFCAVIYFLRGSFYIAGLRSLTQIHIDRAARIHLGALLAIMLGTVALGIFISRFDLLTSERGIVFGAMYADINVRIFMLWTSVIAAALAAASALVWAWKGTLSLVLGAVSLYVVVGLVGTVIPPLVQKLVVSPNELVKETSFIKHNIAATREAFALDKIEGRWISGDKPITAADILANNLTIKNVPLWDRKIVLSTLAQLQEIRTYYEFVEVDTGRYIIDGEIRQIMLSPRELSSASLPNRNWINERLTFTHGYGIAAMPVNQVTAEGLPVFFVKDLPPQSIVDELSVARPEIYYGELSNDYVVVKTKSKEFNYPKGEENVYRTYDGTGGVKMDSLLKRVLYAIKFQSLELLLSNDITRESRIIYERRIAQRVAKIAPFLTFDRDPYIVIADLPDDKEGGRVFWIVDAYTTSDRYPYSQPHLFNGKRVNYVRNSVKAVVDAYHGSVVFYKADTEDPILKTYSAMFPGVFRPMSEMPKVLVPHLRYPEDIFTLQTIVYSVYHMDDPRIFYNKEDQWEIPTVASEWEGAAPGSISRMQPQRIIMKLPGEKKEEYVLMLPFTPRGKDNLSAWMVARNDGGNYGSLLVYRFPRDELVFGPKQIIGRINQDPVISQQISLWSQGGSQVIQGTLLVIPIEESLLYVRPLYLRAETGKIPELRRIVVAYGNKIAMEKTLEQGLLRIFGGDASAAPQEVGATPPPTPSIDIQERMRRAVTAYEEALRAQRDGDWARYGEAILRLGEILKQ